MKSLRKKKVVTAEAEVEAENVVLSETVTVHPVVASAVQEEVSVEEAPATVNHQKVEVSAEVLIAVHPVVDSGINLTDLHQEVQVLQPEEKEEAQSVVHQAAADVNSVQAATSN